MGKVLTKARPYLVKYPVMGGQSVKTYTTRPEALQAFMEVYKRGKRVQMYKLSMPTDLEVGLHSL